MTSYMIIVNGSGKHLFSGTNAKSNALADNQTIYDGDGIVSPCVVVISGDNGPYPYCNYHEAHANNCTCEYDMGELTMEASEDTYAGYEEEPESCVCGAVIKDPDSAPMDNDGNIYCSRRCKNIFSGE